MTDKNFSQEFHELLTATKEHLTYMQELGVEEVQPIPTVAAQMTTSPSTTQATAARPQTVDKKVRTSTATVASPQPRPPRGAALFGDLAPAAATLKKSSETFEEIWLSVGDCTRCPLFQGRTQIVHTEGNRQARLMFVGEAPGADEDIQGRPFVGRAGQLLTKIIEAIGFKREEVLIGNVNRCRPPGNRPPSTEEAAMCKPFLLREIAAVQPDVIVVLGNTAMKNLLDTREGITKLRGNFQDYKGIKVMPTFHPAYLLRDPSKKRETWEDLKKVRDYLDQLNVSRGSDR